MVYFLKLAAILALTFGVVEKLFPQEILKDTIDLESIIIYSSKTLLGIRAGSKVEIVDSIVLREKINLSLSELLIENSPLFIKTYGRGSSATVSFRGTGASHTQVFWNGIKVNSPMSGEVDFSLIPLFFVDNISIHFGQASMNYGSGALGGSLNLSSHPEWSKTFEAKLYQSIGNFESYSSAANASYGNNLFKGQTRIFRETSQNNFPYHNTAKIGKPMEIQQNADYIKYGIMQELYYRYNHNGILSAKIWALDADRGIPKLMSSFSHDETNRQINENINAVISWQNFSNVGKWRASSGFSHTNLQYQLNKHSAEGNPLPVINSLSNSLSWFNRIGYETEILSWLTTELQAETNLHRVESHEDILSSGYHGEQQQVGVRSSITANPTNRLSVSLMASKEFYDGNPMPLSASMSGSYKIFPLYNLTAKGGVARNYHHPSLNDLYWQPGGNPLLKPEDGLMWEAGLAYLLNQKPIGLDAEITFFASDVKNWIMWLPHLKGFWEPLNLNRVKAKGVEGKIAASFELGKTKIKILGNYAYTRSTIKNAGGIIRPDAHGKQLPFIPIHSGGLAINAHWHNYQIIYTFTHFSERFTTTSNNPNSIRRLYPYYMSTAAIGKDFNLFGYLMGIQIRVDNLLDESYQTILWRPMPGRNYNLLVRFEI